MFKTLFFFFCVVAAALAAPGLIAPALIPAPYTIHNGYSVISHVEPVEQHGYTIVY
ncbi:unnamed protein product [Nezara viridula]|uniref:Neuropeptide n=1 Tax=Nezara viridula TaxID=85310 RepID=A0A9P0HDR2_NEZVI|nr:unnamed protein product [Nezara viridula]